MEAVKIVRLIKGLILQERYAELIHAITPYKSFSKMELVKLAKTTPIQMLMMNLKAALLTHATMSFKFLR